MKSMKKFTLMVGFSLLLFATASQASYHPPADVGKIYAGKFEVATPYLQITLQAPAVFNLVEHVVVSIGYSKLFLSSEVENYLSPVCPNAPAGMRQIDRQVGFDAINLTTCAVANVPGYEPQKGTMFYSARSELGAGDCFVPRNDDQRDYLLPRNDERIRTTV